MQRETEIEKIISLLQSTFEKDAWHGPAVMEVLSEVNDQSAHLKLPNTHSVIELVAHMTTWRIFTIAKLQDKDFTVTDELNFPIEKNWQKVLNDLKDSQYKLVDAIQKFPPDRLGEVIPNYNNKYTFYTLIHGIIHHDLYHTGQIKLILRAAKGQTLQ